MPALTKEKFEADIKKLDEAIQQARALNQARKETDLFQTLQKNNPQKIPSGNVR